MTIIYDMKQMGGRCISSVYENYQTIIERGMIMKHFRRLTFLLSFILILTAGGVVAMAANNGPCEDEERSFAYVQFYNSEKDDIIYVYSFRTPQEGIATSAKGAVYDKKTNTLTLTNCNMPDYRLTTNMMGDNFKIKLVGTSHIGMLSAWGDFYGGSVEIIGDGKLYVNEQQKMSSAVLLQPEGTKSYFRISGNAEVYVYAGKTDGSIVIADYTTVADCFVVNGLTGLKKEQASEMRYDEIQAIIVDMENSYDCHVYTKGDNGKKYTVEDYVRTYYNDDGSIKAENVKGYTLYELMLMPGYTDKYYMREIDDTDGVFDPEKYGYTDTEENVNGYSCRSSMPAKVYIDQNTGDRCVFMRDAVDDSYKEFENFKYDIKGELGDVTDKYGNVMSYCMVEKSKDNVKFTDVEFYDPDYLLSQGYKISGELEYIKGLYKVYSNAKSAVLTSKTQTVCKHTSKVNKVTKKATMTTDGIITTTCKSCGKKLSTSKISKVSAVRLNAASCVYNGKVRTPVAIVKDAAGKTLTNKKDYKVTYSAGRKNVGKYAVKVTLCGNKYKDSKTMYFIISPKGTSIVKKSAGKNCLAVKWNAQKIQTSGYQIQYSTDKTFKKSSKVLNIGKNTATYYKVSKLRRGSVYYVRIRTYKNVKISGKVVKIYSAWSKSVAVRAK